MNRASIILLAASSLPSIVMGEGLFDVGPDYSPPSLEAEIPASFAENNAIAGTFVFARAWWQIFDDPELDALIESALRHNQDLAAAASRVDAARAAAGQARAELFPQLEAQVSAQRGRSLESGYRDTNYVKVPGILSYEIDLWGGVGHGVSAARASAEATQFRYDAAWLSLSAQVAENVFLLRATRREGEIVVSSVKTRREARDVIAAKFRLGIGTELDLARAETELALAEAEAAALDRNAANLTHALALLTGRPAPGFDGQGLGTYLPAPPPIPAGLPASALRHRPDVAANERDLAAAADRIGIAKAAFFPSIRLTGSAGWESGDFDDTFAGSNRVWSFGPQIYLPIFQGGRNKARLAQTQAQFEERYAAFRQSVLVALREIQDALSASHHLADENEAIARALQSAQRAAELSRTRYDAGYVAYLEVVDSERVALSAERSSVRLAAQRLITAIQLVKALGGGWQSDDSPIATPDTVTARREVIP